MPLAGPRRRRGTTRSLPAATARRSRARRAARLPARPLRTSFFKRPTLRIARDLIGKLLVHRSPEGTTAGIIVETEAYTGRNDPGSHACHGRRKRNAPMFGAPGRAYVYQCHMYPLLNVVTEPAGKPGAVLLRALQPLAGLELMDARRRRGAAEPAASNRSGDCYALTSGPGRLCQAMGVGLEHNRARLFEGRLFLALPRRPRAVRIRRSTRVGLRGPAARLPWRFCAAGNPWVSVSPDR